MNIFIKAIVVISLFILPTAATADMGNIGKGFAPARTKKVIPRLKKEFKNKSLIFGDPIFLRIFKQSKELEIWVKGKDNIFKLFKIYPICNLSKDIGPKQKLGDLQSPEGFYSVTPDRLNPWSSRHLGFNIGYPNEYDKLHKRTGSLLMIHGKCTSKGCFAMTDPLIEEIYAIAENALRKGQKAFQVHIFPFRMTVANIKKHIDSPWLDFWLDLKQGHDYFEDYHQPPVIFINKDEYDFAPDYRY